MSAAVLALGSAGGGDDAVGLQVGALITGAQRGDATALVDLLAEHALVVLIDAVIGPEPGRVRELTEADLDGELRPVSSHAVSVPQAVQLARVLHPGGGRLAIVGVEIAPPAPGASLSPPVAAAIPRAVAAVTRILKEHTGA